MKFKANSRRRAIEYEKDIVQYWKDNKTFEKSISQRPTDDSYVFYDGPPFITGVPHHGTLLSSIVKDAVPRYQTMKGKRVERVWGWDCHGLPAENFVEKQLGITDRRDIGTKISLEKYITTARESMVANSESWEGVIDRIGRWVDFKGAYRTMDKDFMESVWWAFKQLHEKGKIYEGRKVLMYDTKFATPVSKAEVTMDNDAYQTVTDPSAFVKFQIVQDNQFANVFAGVEGEVYALGWTTTPWTLPGNTALAINPDIAYCLVAMDSGEQLIVAKSRLEHVLTDDKKQPLEYTVLRELKGRELEGLSYRQLWSDDVQKVGPYATLAVGSFNGSNIEEFKDGEPWKNSWKIYAADFVSDADGTGIVHIAPAYGEDDFELAKQKLLLVVDAIDENGYYGEHIQNWLYSMMSWREAGQPLECWEVNKDIAKALQKAGAVWKIEYIRHEYPFNPRSKQRIMYRAIPSWFFDIQGSKPLMLEKNESINWFPLHLKHGRFAKNIEQAPDWNLSRDRFWATAMPVWKGTDDKGEEHTIVVGSYAELKELSDVELDDYHRPWVDDIEFDKDGVHYTRIDKVIDGWFESGSMPFAQFHYPFENKEKFEANFPGDFIVEYVGQVRAWFYYVHAVNTSLFGDEAFKNVITTGVIAGNDGRKMSKSLGNFTDPNELMDKFSADSLRFLLLSSPLLSGEDFALQDKEVGDVARKLSMIWNMYDFFTMYADVDGWEFDGNLTDPSPDLKNPLDQWIVSRVHQLTTEVETHMDGYDVASALKPILPFIDDASNWYVRRSRRRFWKSEDDADKALAYRTLHYVLVRLSVVIAPFVPFLAEELYRKLTGGESVHLLDWPSGGEVNEPVVTDMETVRDYVNQALSLRAQAGVKIRQPLASLTVPTLGQFVNFEDILTEELNVKQVTQGDELALNLEITPELKHEGLMREVVRHVQAARKNAGLNVDDRIVLNLVANPGMLQQAIKEFESVIAEETLATKFVTDTLTYATTATIEGSELAISLQKD